MTLSADTIPFRPAHRSGRRLAMCLLGPIALAAMTPAAHAHPGHLEDGPPRHYSLFRPVPASALRPLATGRPGRVESPVTVDAGHFQIEMDLVSYARDRRPGESERTLRFGVATLVLGLMDAIDLEARVEPWAEETLETETPARPRAHQRTRLGDLVVRFKWNVKEGYGGRSSVALMPFASLRDDAPADFGVIVPFAIPLSLDTALGATARGEWEHRGRYHARWSGSLAVSRPVHGRLSALVGLWGAVSRVPGERSVATLDTGLMLDMSPDLQLLAGASLGLGDASEDLSAYFGMALRR